MPHRAAPLRDASPAARPAWAGRLGALGLALVLGLPGAAAQDRDEVAQRTVHLLEYVAIDYPAAVQDGRVVSELEYREQLDFLAEVALQLDTLGVPEADPLRDGLAALEEAVRARAAASRVAEGAQSLSDRLVRRFDVSVLPPRPPSVERGRALYAEHCASCHGPAGRGDGPAGVALDPAPGDLTDRERMLALSPAGLFRTITFGVAGTGMAGYADSLDERARWDLAFFSGSLAFHPDEVARGRTRLAGGGDLAGAATPTLADLAQRPARELGIDPATMEVVAYLRTRPQALAEGELPLDVARARLRASWQAYGEGDRRRALDLAISAYLDGFEHAEPALASVDRELRLRVEDDFLRYRGLLREGQPPEQVAGVFTRLEEGLAAAQQSLEGARFGRSAAFLGSFAIATREGLEAVLLVVALCTILVRAGRREGLRYVHAGWLAALGAGAVTWWTAQELVRISGAGREVIEGVTALLATGILFYVSYWLVSKVEVARWQTFLHQRMHSALSRGSLWTLAGVSFVAVYREAFETVLFYQALFAQAGPGGTRPILAGMAGGVALLGLLAAVVFRFGLRLPMRHFFAASSALLYALAIVLAGHGVAALQEAGWLPATFVPVLRFEWLGIHPTLEGLGLQGVLLAVAALGILVMLLQRRPQASLPAA